MHNPFDLAGNLRNLYSYCQQSIHCFLGIEHGQIISAELKKLGCSNDFFKDPSEEGHFIHAYPECWEKVLKHILPKRLNRYPERVTYKTYTYRFTRAYWVEIKSIVEWGKAAYVDVKKTAPDTLTVTSQNIDELLIHTKGVIDGNITNVKVVWNGSDNSYKNDSQIHLISGREISKASVFKKNSKTCGPASDIFNTPFVGVLGTIGGAEDDKKVLNLASQFNYDWFRYSEGNLRIMKDTNITDDIMSKYNLILFGTIETNKIVKLFDGKLPIKISKNGYTLPNGKTFKGEKQGVVFIYPNPKFPNRYIMVNDGYPWGEGRGRNHKFDMIPDYIIYSEELVPDININKFKSAGHFDSNWQFREELNETYVEPK